MTLDDLKQLFERDIHPIRARRRWLIRTTEDTDKGITWLITTDRHIFTISALPDWIGCTVQTRDRTGGHPRFADLPDGKLTEETWQAIVEEIKRWEIRPFQGHAL